MREFPITFIVPVYCVTDEDIQWFDACLASTLRTGGAVSIWDDGSPHDKVRHICEQHNVVYRGSKDNHGPSYARNMAAKYVSTPLLMPLDCDDYVHIDILHIIYSNWLKWDNVPVIPDLIRVWTDGSTKIHKLVDWSPENQAQLLGLASVNVLHLVDQHNAIGGWDESLTAADVYEDSEYNARLFSQYCATNVHIPLVYYRQHQGSRILNSDGSTAASMLTKIRGYEMCCGRVKRRAQTSTTLSSRGTNNMATKQLITAESPSEQDGRLLAQYIGGAGRLTHTYNPSGKRGYRVKQGDYLYVHPDDLQPNTYFQRVNANSANKAQKTPKPSRKAIPTRGTNLAQPEVKEAATKASGKGSKAKGAKADA